MLSVGDESLTTNAPEGAHMAHKIEGKSSAGLFLSEPEVARLLSQQLAEWKAKAIVLERHGLPPIDPLMGGRYWPAVCVFFDRRYGISNANPTPVDGEEDLDALR
jgi:hypothetical protein